ncbi:hypothetical protein KTE49_20535 [Burkholderia multivorans]|uniref:Uncharacterized protein n=1 Tax=Burkholderia multivorans CGD2 TaxID=513052 RepID=B9BQJ2_9BURK|nr:MULTISPECIES: hypothetical protein [Burkholderia cepacia complex]EEE06887.1 hypothetical protein BURMUCGD2_1177 [Burkholderia multivorans CGD2]EEE13169.1 hypothetical protein BURMUCGD2M_1268 [Burkholderia multivorans CGD2M]MBU9532825.1 hypothetical protein [Burkholderia multivorans]MBY4752011.1 hypothetical protein [Burkholderia dolosa]MCO1343443.1 hypothetical protein [Burkholderia multivorans]
MIADTTREGDLIERLDRLIDALEKQANRSEDTLWDAAQIAKWLGLSKTTVEIRVVTRPGFPAALRPAGAEQGQRRWFANEVVEWARKNRGTLPEPRKGRPRKTVS